MKQSFITKEDILFQLANPHQITFEITDACNLKCKYCAYGEFYEDYDERKERFLPVDYAKKVIDYLTKFWTGKYNLSSQQRVYIGFYGGEPLLNMPFVEEIVNYVNGLNLNNKIFFEFAMTSNALLLHRYQDFLSKHKFNLLISLDGDRENTAYRVFGNGQPAFDHIIKNIDLLQKSHPDYFRKYVNFNAVLHNKNSVENIYSYIKERYDKIPAIGELNDMGIREDKRELFAQTYRNYQESIQQSEHYESIEKGMFIKSATYQTVCTFLHQYSGYVFKDYTDLMFDTDETRRIPTGTCIPFSKKMFVTVNGKILPCERIGQQFALGSVDENGVHLDLNKISEKYNAYYAKLENQCSVCRRAKSCVQCIFNLENLEKKPICNGFMNEDNFQNYVNEQLLFLSEHPEDYYRIMEEVIVE